MFEVKLESCVLIEDIDFEVLNGKTLIWLKDEINILPLAVCPINEIFIKKGKIPVIRAPEETMKEFTDFVEHHGHLKPCLEILQALGNIYNYSYEITEFGEDTIISSSTCHTAVLAAIKTAAKGKVYFTNKLISFHSNLLN